jgi:cyclopropane fatty-acyl-phospholipid synthase-like methyltransferase
MLSVGRIKAMVKSRFRPNTLTYNVLAWSFGLMTNNPEIRRAAAIWARKDSRFHAAELHMASLLPTHLLDAVLDRWKPTTVLDIGCGTGQAVNYLVDRGVDCVGLEGSQPAIDASPVHNRIKLVNLNRPVALGRMFDVVWSYEVAEHIHPKYTDAFLQTLTTHGPVIILSAARPGQGGVGHFNEQPPLYWIERIERRGFLHVAEASAQFQALPDEWARNVLVFVRQP